VTEIKHSFLFNFKFSTTQRKTQKNTEASQHIFKFVMRSQSFRDPPIAGSQHHCKELFN